MVVVIDVGLGNIGSVLNMLRKVGASGLASSSRVDIANAEKLILPGVGSFDTGMMRLEQSGVLPVLEERVLIDKVPILGICLGMQLMGRGSEEGKRKGLGWIQGWAIRFRQDGLPSPLKVPHMCWNGIRLRRSHSLFRKLEEKARFYFVHSYHLECEEEAAVLSTTQYGCEFVSAVAVENVMGVQFHPEKSHRFGFQLIHNFVELI